MGLPEPPSRCPAIRIDRTREPGWIAALLASPYASFTSGETLVVDGANGQRLGMRQPITGPTREQMGNGLFDLG